MEEIYLDRLTKFVSNIKNLSSSSRALCVLRSWSDDDLEQASIMSSKLQAVLNRFNNELYQYFNASTNPNADDISNMTTEQLEGEEALAELNAKIQVKRDNDHSSGSSRTVNRGKLPELSLPTFSGEVLHWSQFWDQFSSNIDQRELRDVDKLLYLKTSLKGEAKRILDGLETTNDNYKIAVTTLMSRYGKTNQIIDAHYSSLYKLKRAGKQEECRGTLDEIEKHLRVLSSLGENIDHNHLRFLIMDKFTEDVIYELKLKLSNESIEEIRKQLHFILSAREDAKRTYDGNSKEEVNYTTETLHVSELKSKRKQKLQKANTSRIASKRIKPNLTAFNKTHNVKGNSNFNEERDSQGPGQKERKTSCIFCNGEHFNDECTNVKTLIQRKLKLKNRCFICLRTGHSFRSCQRKHLSCPHCGRRGQHNRALCPKKMSQGNESTSALHVNGNGSTILQTAVIRVLGPDQTSLGCRVLLDSGSQRSYVTQDVAKNLKLKTEEKNHLMVFTFGSDKPKELNSSLVKLNIQTRTNKHKIVFANVVPSITQGISSYSQQFTEWKHHEDYLLADDGSLSDKVDILIGNDYYHSFMSTEKVEIKENLYLVNSDLGWILSGKTRDNFKDGLSVPTELKTVTDAMNLYEESKQLFSQISMNLREWSSNAKEFVKQIPDASEEVTVKTLGLNWNLGDDILHLRAKVNENNDYTKRGILKTIAAIYDPCGFSAPIILPAKLLLQQLWKTPTIKWDTLLPEELNQKWKAILEEMKQVETICLPRNITIPKEKEAQVHCFTDSSTVAYSAVTYLLQKDKVNFIIGKSRLVPIKDQENLKIPRLELLGVLIGSRLIKYVLRFLQLNVTQVTLWTDSQIVIDWYYSDKLLEPFVSRRLEEIRQNKSLVVRYVPSELNPADVATRPTASEEERSIWLSGPEFLRQNPMEWPLGPSRATSLLTGEGLLNTEKPQRITTPNGELRSDETLNSQLQEIKELQEKFFPEESKGKKTHLSHNLGLFIDTDGILRCDGRLTHSDLSFDAKHPILLPKNCEYTKKIIKEIHEKNLHVGVPHTLSLIRQKYWIPQGRAQVQKVLSKCARCVKHGGGPYALPKTPALPAERVRYTTPYTYVGVDYFGPMFIKSKDGPKKRWICLFTCLVIRAIQLEVVKDLTTDECLMAFRRFIATRGTPMLILTDNAPQFRLLAEIMTEEGALTEKIEWKFIPQLAPWHGGAYERLVAVVKHCLKRTLEKHMLEDSQLLTIIKEVEAVVNTRPLTYVGADVDHILKPVDFLTPGKCLNVQVLMEHLPLSSSIIKQQLVEGWKRGDVIMNEYKDMFINRYLLSLRERYRNSPKQARVRIHEIPRIGDVVQIRGESRNREGWKVGKIIEIVKGTDNLCRIARVKVGNKIFTRSIAHLYPLEVDENETQENTTGNISKQDAYRDVCIDINNLPQLPIEFDDRVTDPMMGMSSDQIDDDNDRVVRESQDLEQSTGETLEKTSIVNENDTEETQNPTAKDSDLNIQSNDETGERPVDERQRRAAAVHALGKIHQWTRDLMTNIH